MDNPIPDGLASDGSDLRAPTPLPPFSGLAITAFVLSFICGFVAIVGPWETTLIPIAMAILAIYLTTKTGKRGRILAIFALLVAAGFGSCSYKLHTEGREVFANVPRSMLAILGDAKLDAAAKDEALAKWAWPTAVEEDAGLVASWRETYDKLVAEHGAQSGQIEYGDHVPGFMALVVPPSDRGDEVHPRTDADPPAPGGAIWVKVPFEKATLWMCVAMGTGTEDNRQAVQDFKEDEPSPIVGSVRYFRLD